MSLIQNSQSAWVDDSDYAESGLYPESALHFWDMHEIGVESEITDIISGATITTTGISPGSSGSYVNLIANVGTGNLLGGGHAIGNRDFLIVVVAKSVGSGSDNGHTGFYWKNLVNTFKCHPYYANSGDTSRTLPYYKNWIRTVGEIYAHAIVRRGVFLEHYCLPRGFIDSLDILKSNSPQNAGYIDVPRTTSLGHGGYGTPSDNGVGRDIVGSPWTSSGNVGQDYAGIAVHAFNTAPTMDVVVKGMRWCKDEWTTKTSGKRLYPGW